MTILKKGNDEGVEEGVKGINGANRKKHKISKGESNQRQKQKAKKKARIEKIKTFRKA